MAARKVTVYLTDEGARLYRDNMAGQFKRSGFRDTLSTMPPENFKRQETAMPETDANFKTIARNFGFKGDASKYIERIEVGGYAKFDKRTGKLTEVK